MRIFVVGGSKGVGRQVVEKAVAAGHQVTLMARRPRAEGTDALEGVDVVAGDATQPQPVHDALDGHDAVVIALGGALSDRSTRSIATANVLGGMARHGVERVVAVSSVGAGDSLRRLGFAGKAIVKTLLRNAIKDHEAQEAALSNSDRRWTIVRPAGLTDDPTDHMVIDDHHSPLSARKRVSRAGVADVVLEALQRDDWTGKAVHVLGA